MNGKVRTIAIIGAGPSGLCCAKNSLEHGFEVTVYEQNGQIGGIWIYSDRIGNDEFSLPIHSSMYKGVVTNIPVELIGFFNCPYPKKQKSFVPHEDVLEFYQSYASQYNLDRIIKFRNHVVNVKPKPNNRWEIFSKDLLKNTYETKVFDAIFICNGHYSAPYIPSFEGIDEFRGHKMHSHDYREPEQYQDEIVLIVGCGPSAKDILFEVASKAKKVFFSHHRNLNGLILPANVQQVGDIEYFKENSIQFKNDVEEYVSCVLFCTGYTFSFPFLSVDCGLCLHDMFQVQPLYKHLININQPTMAIVGLQICAYSYMYDLQARLCLKFWNGDIELPTKERMFEEFRIENERRMEKGNGIRKTHLLNEDQRKYFEELSEIGQMIKVPNVLLKIFDDCSDLRIQYPNTYREFNYKIIDDESFERNHLPN